MKKVLIDRCTQNIFAKKYFVLDVFGRFANMFLLEKLSFKNCKTKWYEKIIL